MYLISTEGKSPEKIANECWKAHEAYRLAEEKSLKEMSQEEERSYKKPIQCLLWQKNELTSQDLHNGFELIETYEENGHFSRRLVKCKECGQLYFKEFYEWIDWENGNDPQYTTFIPVEIKDDIERLKRSNVFELLEFRPCLRSDFPSSAIMPKVYWLGKN